MNLLSSISALSLAGLSMLAVAQELPANIPRGFISVPSVKKTGMTPTIANIAYGELSKTLMLDLYRPDAGEGPFPIMIYIHGGGFKLGTRSMASAALVKGFQQEGYAVASIDYRLSGEAVFPAAV